jgi:hypothetical protein
MSAAEELHNRGVRIEELRARNAELVAALERIVNRAPWQGRKDFGPGDDGLADYWACVCHEQREIALAALAAAGDP